MSVSCLRMVCLQLKGNFVEYNFSTWSRVLEDINTICWKFNFLHHLELVEPSWVGSVHCLLVTIGPDRVILKIWRVGLQKLDL